MAKPKVHETVAAFLKSLGERAKSAKRTKDFSQPAGRLKISMKQVPWNNVLEWYAAQANLTLVVKSAIPGTFLFKDGRSYTLSETLDLLNSVLLTKGFAIIRRDNLLYVADLEKKDYLELAPVVNESDLANRGKFELVKTILPLGKADLKAVEKDITPLLSRAGLARVLPESRKISIVDRTQNIRQILEVIKPLRE